MLQIMHRTQESTRVSCITRAQGDTTVMAHTIVILHNIVIESATPVYEVGSQPLYLDLLLSVDPACCSVLAAGVPRVAVTAPMRYSPA